MEQTKTTKEKVTWDGVVKGLGLRVRGKKQTWIVQTRVHGRTMKRVIGDGDMTRPLARDTAREVLAQLRLETEPEPKALVKVSEFGKRFIADKSEGWAASTIKGHTNSLDTKIIPCLGSKRIGDVTRVDVISWLDDLRVAPPSKNRSLAVLSGIMRHAELLELRQPGNNPCKGLRRRGFSFKATYLTKAEFAHLGAAFQSLEKEFPNEIAVLRFVALTGCRKSEALDAKWTFLDGARLALPNAKSGPRSVWLGKAALRVLEQQDAETDFLFSKDGEQVSEGDLYGVWKSVRKHCNMPRLRIHDLRHSFASTAISNGIGLRTIGGLLGHRDLSSTAGYAHLQEDALKASVARVGAYMSGLLAIKDTIPKSHRQLRVVDGVATDGPPKRGRKPKPKPVRVKLVAETENTNSKAQALAQARAAKKREALALARRKKLRREKQARIAAQLRAYRNGKLSVPDFCQKHDLSERVFRENLYAARNTRRAAA